LDVNEIEPSTCSEGLFMNAEFEKVRMTISYLMKHSAQQPALDELAQRVNLSPAYFQRIFRKMVGVSPKRFLQFLTAQEAKRLLRDSISILETAFEVGCSGPGRLHDLMINTVAMSPGEFAQQGAGNSIQFGVTNSPFGPCLLAKTERGLCNLKFLDPACVDTAFEELGREWPKARLVRNDREMGATAQQIFQDKCGEILVHLTGTNFQLKVWEGLLRMPEQSLISYQELARRLNTPQATRAVANAVGANPVAYLIPCHRVIRSSGALGGYRWGLERKAMILAKEWKVQGYYDSK
jgi:AraC family transcriptional regulator, regulatory protein of adaptative response / methylated-DNA-[protein]-cysteine methyltransferase